MTNEQLSLRKRAKELGIHHSTLRYKEDPEYRIKRRLQTKKCYEKHRAERLEAQRAYYKRTYKPKKK